MDPMDTEILYGMTMAIWCEAYVAQWEQAVEDGKAERTPWGPGAQLMDECGEPDCDLTEDVSALYRCIEGDNKVSLAGLCEKYEWDRDEFGHYLALQAMGHGTGWWDEDREIEPLKLPHIEPGVDVPEVNDLYK